MSCRPVSRDPCPHQRRRHRRHRIISLHTTGTFSPGVQIRLARGRPDVLPDQGVVPPDSLDVWVRHFDTSGSLDRPRKLGVAFDRCRPRENRRRRLRGIGQGQRFGPETGRQPGAPVSVHSSTSPSRLGHFAITQSFSGLSRPQPPRCGSPSNRLATPSAHEDSVSTGFHRPDVRLES